MREPSSILETALRDPFWEQAAAIYRKVRWIPPQRMPPSWRDLSVYAARYGLATDAVYLARVSHSALADARRRASALLAEGRYAADTLYVLDDRVLRDAALDHTAINYDATADVLARVDGFNVLAPGWKKRSGGPSFGSTPRPRDLLPPLAPGRKVFMGRGGAGTAFLPSEGWSAPEDWGTWSDGPQAEILLPAPPDIRAIRMEAVAMVHPGHPTQAVVIEVDGAAVCTVTLSKPTGNLIEIPISDAMRRDVAGDGVLRLRLIFKDAVRPVDVGINDDRRRLAVGLQTITVE